MSSIEKKNKGRIVILFALIGVFAMVYVSYSYKTKHNHSVAESIAEVAPKEKFQVVESVDSADTNNEKSAESMAQNDAVASKESHKNTTPSLPKDAKLPANIPPAMLKAMQERGMDIDDLRGNAKSGSMGKGSMGNMGAGTDGTMAANMEGKNFPEAMQKALAERNAQQANQANQANNPNAVGAGETAHNDTQKQFPAFIYQAIKHVENHQNNEQIAQIKLYLDTLEKDPLHVQTLINFSNLFLSHNEIQGATYFLEKASVTTPSDPEIAYLYGKALSKNFDSEEAAAQWERSLAIQESALVRYDLALLYRYQLNKAELSKEYLEKALATPDIDSTLKGAIARELKR